MRQGEKRKAKTAPTTQNISQTRFPPTRLPITDLEGEELIERYEWMLKACYLQKERRLLIPSDIREVFDQCRVEIDRRELRIDIPAILCAEDGMPVMHQKAIVRYLRQPHLSEFLAGVISFAPAADYRLQNDAARNDDEHARPYSIFPNQKILIGGVEYEASKIRMYRRIGEDRESRFPYHFVSFSSEESHKLARDFGSDGAVLIRDYQRFYDLLQGQLATDQPGATLHFKAVEYYDPFGIDPSANGSIDILWRKPIKFIYQREIRIIILGATPVDKRINLRIPLSAGFFEAIRFH